MERGAFAIKSKMKCVERGAFDIKSKTERGAFDIKSKGSVERLT